MALVKKPLRVDLPEESLLADYDAGMSLTKLAEKYKTSRPTVKSRLLTAGREIRPKESYPKRGRKKKVVDHEDIAAKIERDREIAEAKKAPKPKTRKIGW